MNLENCTSTRYVTATPNSSFVLVWIGGSTVVDEDTKVTLAQRTLIQMCKKNVSFRDLNDWHILELDNLQDHNITSTKISVSIELTTLTDY